MDSNRILHLLTGFLGAVLLVRSLRTRVHGFAVAALVVVLTAAAGALFFADSAGYVTAVVFTVAVGLPLYGQRVILRLLSQQRYGAAAQVASALRFLHPEKSFWQRPRLFHALDLGQKGRADEAIAVLSEIEASGTALAREARVHLLRMRGRWEDVAAWLEEQRSAKEGRRDLSLLPIHLRALGEIGDLSRLVALYAENEASLDRTGPAGPRDLCRLFVFAFTGRADRVDALFRGPLSLYSKALQVFWRATAELVLEPDGPARDELAALLDEGDEGLRRSVERRLHYPLKDPRGALSPEAMSVLMRMEKARDQEERYGLVQRTFRPYATFAIMALILAVFAVEELKGGSENPEVLFALGALWPKEVLKGEIFRLGAATFLHYGALHLLLNLAGLYVLGPYVEFALGRARYLVVYLGSGIGTMLVVVLLYRAKLVEPQLIVGASGAIMGLCGATGAVMWRGLRREGSALARRRLGSVLFLVVVQAIFDALTPQVSSLSHFGGALLGALLASLMAHKVTPSRQRAEGANA